MSEKFKVEKEDEKDKKDQFIFKVYIPNNDKGRKLKNKLISFAKLYYDNKVWKVLKHGMNLIEKSEDAVKVDHEKRIQALENKVKNILENDKNQEKKNVNTFGGEKNDK